MRCKTATLPSPRLQPPGGLCGQGDTLGHGGTLSHGDSQPRLCVCISVGVHLSPCVCARELCTPVPVWVAGGEGPRRSTWAGYVKEQPELPRASRRAAAWGRSGGGCGLWAVGCEHRGACPEPFSQPAAAEPSAHAGPPGAGSRRRVSSSPEMAGQGPGAAAAGEGCGERGAAAGGPALGCLCREVSACWAGL